jgi:hypothetical protein
MIVMTKDLYFFLIGCAVLLFIVIVASVRSGRKERVGQVVIAFVLLEVAGLFIWMAHGLDVSPLMDSNPATVPIVWAAALAVFAVYQLIRVWRGETPPDPKTGHIGKVFLTVVIVFVCILGIEYAGFYIATSGMIVLTLLLLGEYRLKVLLISPLSWSIFAWLCFEKLLRLGLPVGKFWM